MGDIIFEVKPLVYISGRVLNSNSPEVLKILMSMLLISLSFEASICKISDRSFDFNPLSSNTYSKPVRMDFTFLENR